MTIVLRALALAAIAFAAFRETMPGDADLSRDSRTAAASISGLPPYAPHSEESALSAQPVREIVHVVAPSAAPAPFIDYAAQIPLPRPRHHLAALEMGNGRDAGWMAYEVEPWSRL
jgi:hypothetical protein